MFGLAPNQLGAIGVLIVGGLYMLYANWDSIPKFKLPWGASKAKADKPDRKAALSAFDDAVGYLEAIKCEAGVKLMQQALPHFFDHKD